MIESELNKSERKSSQIVANIPECLGSIWKIELRSAEEFAQSKLARIFSLTKLTEVHTEVALIYAKKLVNRVSQRPHLTTQGYYNYFIGCLMLASKFLDDITFKNNSWSYVSGIALSQINHIEQAILRTLDFCIFVNKDDIQAEKQSLDRERRTRQRENLVSEIMREQMFSLDCK